MNTRVLRLIPFMLSIAVGSSVSLFNMTLWFIHQDALALVEADKSTMVLNFFLSELFAIVLLAVGLVYLMRNLGANFSNNLEVRSLISESLRSTTSVRVGVIFGLIYGLVYALSSSTLVFQPSTDFGQAYGVTQPSLFAISCCGSFGTVPKLILFLDPQLHIGVQLVPLTALFLVIVPVLVGLNFAFVSFALSVRSAGRTGSLLTAMGAVVGLFTACPTCAGLFLAGAVGGIGATSLAISLAPYQVLFVIFSIPVLLLSPVIVASAMRRYIGSSCKIEC